MNTDRERAFMPDELSKLDRPGHQPQAFDGRIWTCAREAILSTTSWQKAHGRHFLVDESRGLVLYRDTRPFWQGTKKSLHGNQKVSNMPT